ncbi:MAG: hypothetical protein COV10_00075 [Candidatus Vogelbacteria bacterium CG10_big_fil_rev_8_21_14_0_10_51_16]|uniref:DUF5667 domain-containing protein n=1 Tax=Candidatus Vogelbacteria bacterium CG10_big_fil_rev_8_21_14_0_10_51_16 TaxID=1975045 RepID=A0A2H0RFR7_9BACT|nr:MAG: hypothetical protein COV10_00075 [Candidatus Vogelbacteria bacterium CG10_big_fil_rev_8_21_14_0_10_51_16]
MQDLLTKVRQHITLGERAKRNARIRIVSSMSAGNANSDVVPTLSAVSAQQYQQWSVFLGYQMLARRRVVAFLVAAFVILGSSVSLAAADALPGEALYVIKKDINEPFRRALAVSKESRAKLEAELALLRLEELATLAERGSLTVANRSALEADFLGHMEKVNASVSSVVQGQKAGEKAFFAAEFNSDLEISLQVREKVLALVSAGNDDNSVAQGDILVALVAVREQREAVAKERMKAEDLVVVQPDQVVDKIVVAKIRNLDTLITRAEETARRSLLVADTAREESSAYLAVAKELMREANLKLEADSSREAFGLAQNAKRIATEVLLFSEEASRRPHIATHDLVTVSVGARLNEGVATGTSAPSASVIGEAPRDATSPTGTTIVNAVPAATTTNAQATPIQSANFGIMPEANNTDSSSDTKDKPQNDADVGASVIELETVPKVAPNIPGSLVP